MVKAQFIAVPGLREVPDNTQISAYFPSDLNVDQMSVGDTFTVAVENPAAAFGPATYMSGDSFPAGTLVEFRVEKSQGGSSTAPSRAIVRATYILIPDRNAPDTDIAIPVATASLLPPGQAGPVEANRFDSARRGEEIGSTVGMLGTNSTHNYFLIGALGKAAGYVMGRQKENAAGDSFLQGSIPAGTACVVRINRRILF